MLYKDVGNLSVFVLSHVFKEHISKIEELPRYSGFSFISDAGGILGVFLGISFWSIYSDLIGPIIGKFERYLKPKNNLIKG